MPVGLNIFGLIDGAKAAAAEGLSFDDYCEMVASVLISGQTKDELKALLTQHEIDTLFDDTPAEEGKASRICSICQDNPCCCGQPL